jgi:hypothetical protein
MNKIERLYYSKRTREKKERKREEREKKERKREERERKRRVSMSVEGEGNLRHLRRW